MASVPEHPLLQRLAEARRSRRPLVFAHRGYSDVAVENTLPAFLRAIEAGSDGIELDVQLSRDGKVCVFHDRDLSRLIGDRRAVSDLDSSELRTLRPSIAGINNDRSGAIHAGIPLLAEVLDLVDDRILLDIELKSYRAETRIALVERVVDLIGRFNGADRIMLSSFDPRIVRALRRTGVQNPTAVIFSGDQEVPFVLRRGLGLRIAGAEIAKPSVAHVLAGRRPGRELFLAWTVADIEEVDELVRRGAAGIITNDPSAVRERIDATAVG